MVVCAPLAQIEYIKDEQRHLKREMLRAQEVRRETLPTRESLCVATAATALTHGGVLRVHRR